MSNKMTLEPEVMVLLERKIERDPALRNGFRLFSDASLLFDCGRYASSVALAFLALEEVGKYLLTRWSAEDNSFRYDKKRLHVMKQGAVAAIFLAYGARSECKKNGFDFNSISSLEDVTRLCKFIRAGLEREKEFACHVLDKIVEMAKWSGMYYDEKRAEKGLQPENIKESDAKSVMETSCKAFMLIADEKNIAIGKFTFPYIYSKALPIDKKNADLYDLNLL